MARGKLLEKLPARLAYSACERAAESGEIFVLRELARRVFLKLVIRALESFAERGLGIFGQFARALRGAFALCPAALGAREPALGLLHGLGRREPAVLGGDEGACGEHLVEHDARKTFQTRIERLAAAVFEFRRGVAVAGEGALDEQLTFGAVAVDDRFHGGFYLLFGGKISLCHNIPFFHYITK